jgi:hypothetical protein
MIDRRILFVACSLTLFAGRARAQSGSQSDITGPPVTSGDIVGAMFIPTGPTAGAATDFLRAPDASAYASAALRVEAQLRAGALTAFKDASTTIRIPETTQRTLLNLVRGVDCKGAEDSLVNAITRDDNLGNSNVGTPDAIARRLAHSLCNLTSRAATVDPTRANTFAAAQIQEAVAAYNAVIDNSKETFLLNPPPEILAIGSALGTIVNDAWNANTRSPRVATSRSRSTSTQAAPVTPAPVRAIMESITVCIVDPSANGGLRSVDAIHNRNTGDTTFVSNGATVPLSSTIPAVPVASEALWFQNGRPLTIGNGAEKIQYVPAGAPRVMPAGNIELLGTVNGLPVYADRTVIGPIDGLTPQADLSATVDEDAAIRKAIEARDPVVYVPLKRTGCIFQPLQMLEKVKKPSE